jgi:hypothetical protein
MLSLFGLFGQTFGFRVDHSLVFFFGAFAFPLKLQRGHSLCYFGCSLGRQLLGLLACLGVSHLFELGLLARFSVSHLLDHRPLLARLRVSHLFELGLLARFSVSHLLDRRPLLARFSASQLFECRLFSSQLFERCFLEQSLLLTYFSLFSSLLAFFLSLPLPFGLTDVFGWRVFVVRLLRKL